MPELDHVFVCCDVGAPEASALSRLGLTEGSPNTQPTSHALALSELTGVDIALASARPLSPAAQAAAAAGVVRFSSGEEHAMRLTFDRGARGTSADLRPDLPLLLQW